ncbi:hypothetical protein FPV67DRAFT_1672965 [Lyophyllum atratum]|nr:hypothetical protein FPV67DRAFT_1672965 [Lyophyllum atratum]
MDQSSSPPAPVRPLSDLRMTEKEWTEYRNVTQPSEAYKTFVGHGTISRLRVIGFNRATKNVLRASNPAGDDYIEIDWSATDRLLWIGQRVEDKIRVALHHWVLAGSDGIVFKNPSEPVDSSDTFKTDYQVVLTLLVPSDLPEYATSHMKGHPLLRLIPEQTESTDPRDMAAAEFHLINPEPSAHWGTYLAQRKANSEQLKEAFFSYKESSLPLIYETIEDAIHEVLSSTDLRTEMEDVLHDCVIPLSPEVSDDGDCNIRTAEILTRIYSPTCPSAVDVYLDYHHRSLDSSVEFHCNIYYREHREVSKDLDRTIPQGALRHNGFKPMLQIRLADIPPGPGWRAVIERSFDISPFEVASLHWLLFGQPSGVHRANLAAERSPESDSESDLPLHARISAIHMMELLLASVGVGFTTAREDGNEDTFSMGEMEWTGLKGHERWFGRNLRRVCDVNGLEGDDKDSEDEGMDVDDDDAY